MKNQVHGILAIVAIVAVVGLMSGFSGCTTQEGGNLAGEAISINRDNWDYVRGVLFPSARGLQDIIEITQTGVNIDGVLEVIGSDGTPFLSASETSGALNVHGFLNVDHRGSFSMVDAVTVSGESYCNGNGENCFSAEEFISKQDVLDMLNSCQPTIVDEFSTDYSSSSCNTVCTDLGKTCILTNALNINLDGDTTLVNCGFEWNELQSYQIFNCVCC